MQVKGDNNYAVRKLGTLCIDLEKGDRATAMIARLQKKEELFYDLEELAQMQRDDMMIKCLRNRESKLLEICEDSGIWYCKSTHDMASWKLLILRVLVVPLLSSVHQQLGHAGSSKMIKYLQRLFFWRHMRKDVKVFTRGCDICQKTKYINYRMEGTFELVGSSLPNQLVAVDFFGPLPTSVSGVQYIFVLQDIFSKYMTLYPIKRATTKICLQKLKELYFDQVGKPTRILSDNGTQFSSPNWKMTIRSWGITAIFSSVRHPQSNPVERTMRELGRLFRTYCPDKHTAWSRHIEKNTIHF